MSTPLRTFTGQIDGASATVTVYVDRLEWVRGSGVRAVPVKEFGSVSGRRSGLNVATVSVLAEGEAFDFRVDRAQASAIVDLLRTLKAGAHPAQQPAPLIPPFPVAATPGGAMIPAQSTMVDVPNKADGLSR